MEAWVGRDSWRLLESPAQSRAVVPDSEKASWWSCHLTGQGVVPVQCSPLNEKVCHCPNADELIKGFAGTLQDTPYD